MQRMVVLGHEPNGLHMRPATEFARTARKFHCTVTVSFDGQEADGTSPTELLMLIALPGSELHLAIDGPDAPEAIEALSAILTAKSAATAASGS